MSEAERVDPQSLPGCGLGVYALLLVALGTAGLVGMVFAIATLLQGEGSSPKDLLSGKAVPTWRLAPLVEAGVLPVGEIPLAWHDESLTASGSRACALIHDAVIRVEDGKGTRVPFAEVEGVSSEDMPDGAQVIRVDGKNADILCLFGEGEGGVRFMRQIQAEQLKVQRGQGG